MASRGRPRGAAGRAPRTSRGGVAQQRRSRAALPTRAKTPQHRPNLTARAAILAVALASVALALALPFKVWIAQRGEIQSLAQQTEQTKQQIHQLEQQNQRWHDPAYIKQQARVRLHMAEPGETTYVVLDKPRHQRPAAKAEQQPALTGPWYSQLWQSTVIAGGDASP